MQFQWHCCSNKKEKKKYKPDWSDQLQKDKLWKVENQLQGARAMALNHSILPAMLSTRDLCKQKFHAASAFQKEFSSSTLCFHFDSCF